MPEPGAPPADEPSTLAGPRDLAQRAIVGFRWVMILNLATVPFSFATNVILGRVSPVALGYYSAVGLFVNTLQTFLFLGGYQVFTRFVPVLHKRDRMPFLLSYTSLVMGLFFSAAAIAALFRPEWIWRTLAKFGDPAPALALAFAVSVLLLNAECHFLWGVLEAKAAAIVNRSAVAGFFLVALIGLGPLRRSLAENPSGFLWVSAFLVYGGASLLGIASVARAEGTQALRGVRWFLPVGFWMTVLYAHLETVVVFVYSSVAQAVVFLWLDVASLGFFHPALRWLALFDAIPFMLSHVVSPGLARLQAAGLKEAAFRQASAAMNAILLFLVPVALALAFFAPDAMLLFGREYRAHADLLRIVSISILAGAVIYVGGGMLAAFGALRSYLVASLAYAVAAIGLTFVFVPRYGLMGAAMATTLGALLRQIAVTVALARTLGFRLPARVYAAWVCVVAAVATAQLLEPGRMASAALFALFLAAFALAGRLTRQEAVTSVRRLLGAD